MTDTEPNSAQERLECLQPLRCPCGCGAMTGGRWRLRCLQRAQAAARPKWRGTFREAVKARAQNR